MSLMRLKIPVQLFVKFIYISRTPIVPHYNVIYTSRVLVIHLIPSLLDQVRSTFSHDIYRGHRVHRRYPRLKDECTYQPLCLQTRNEVILTNTDASTTRSPLVPFTSRCVSTTPHVALRGDMRAVDVGCQIDTTASFIAASISSSVSASPTVPKRSTTKPVHGAADTKRRAALTAASMTCASKGEEKKAGSMMGKAKGSEEASVTDPTVRDAVSGQITIYVRASVPESGVTTAEYMVRKCPVGGWGAAVAP